MNDRRRVALVTGANRGIGRAVVRQLLERGFRTILTARDEDRGRAAADDDGADFFLLDVADEAGVDRCFRMVDERFGRLDVLINNEDIPADLAERYGYVNRAVPPESVDGFVLELARRIASYPPEAVALTKAAINHADTHAMDGYVSNGGRLRSVQADKGEVAPWPSGW